MKKKLSSTVVKIALLAALAFSFPLIQAPASHCFAADDPIQDGSKGKPKQGPKQEEPKAPIDPIVLLILWLLT